ncbi:MAG: DUF998 domain-containing protein [Oryzihumus sp.]
MAQVTAVTASSAPRADRLTKGLLACGAVYAVTYVVANDLLAAAMIRGYNRLDQAVSELSATGAAARPFLSGMDAIWVPTMVAFGVGVWRAARGNRWLRVTGALLVVFGVTSLMWLAFPMTARQDVVVGAAVAANDIGHIGMTALTAVFVLAGIGSSAAGLGKGFRIYCAATVVVIVLFGLLTGAQAPARRPGPPDAADGLLRTRQHRGLAALDGRPGRRPVAQTGRRRLRRPPPGGRAPSRHCNDVR